MSATEELIAAEAGKMSLDEKKASVAESKSSISSSSSSSSSASSVSSRLSNKHCHCVPMRNYPCQNPTFQGCQLQSQPCMMAPWGILYLAPPCYYNHCPGACCQVSSKKCHAKRSAKKLKPKKEKLEDAVQGKTDEKACKCCQEGKCECCKTGKECGKDDDNASVKSDKSGKSDKSEKDGAGSGEGGEGKDEQGEEDE